MNNIERVIYELESARSYFAEGRFLRAAEWAFYAHLTANKYKALRSSRLAADARALALIAASNVLDDPYWSDEDEARQKMALIKLELCDSFLG